MRGKLPEFPSLVIAVVLEYACSAWRTGAGDLNLDLPATVRYSLVSRSWREEARKLMFHQIDFTSMRRFVLMRTFIRSNSTAATHVRVLSLGIGQNYHTHVQGTELPDVMNMFPYLYELRLYLDNPPKLTTVTIQQLSSTPPISALRLTLSETDQCPDVLLQLLQVPWPLRHLSVSRPFASPVYWLTEEKIQEDILPPWKLTEYRTDRFLGWELLLEWIVLSSLETLTVLHMPPDPKSVPLTLVSPRLRSLNLVYDLNNPGVFGGMWDYPPFPMLQELLLTNALLLPDPIIYESFPPNVISFGTTLCIKLETMLEICPLVPMRGTINVYHDGILTYDAESMVDDYLCMDSRLVMKMRQVNAPCMVPFRGRPRDDTFLHKRYMDRAVANRVVLSRQNTTSTPWWLLMIYNAFSAASSSLPAKFASRSSERPVARSHQRATLDVYKPLPELCKPLPEAPVGAIGPSRARSV